MTGAAERTAPDLTEKVYEAALQGKHATDAISFKLLGLVPLISGAGLLAVVFKTEPAQLPMLPLLCVFAALMSLGLFYWELRNIQRCNVCTRIAHIVEESCGIRGLKQDPPGRMGKTGSEKLIYATIVMTWLAVPFLAGIPPNGTRPYVLASGIIVALTINAVFTSCEARPKVDWPALSDGNGKDGESEARSSGHTPP